MFQRMHVGFSWGKMEVFVRSGINLWGPPVLLHEINGTGQRCRADDLGRDYSVHPRHGCRSRTVHRDDGCGKRRHHLDTGEGTDTPQRPQQRSVAHSLERGKRKRSDLPQGAARHCFWRKQVYPGLLNQGGAPHSRIELLLRTTRSLRQVLFLLLPTTGNTPSRIFGMGHQSLTMGVSLQHLSCHATWCISSRLPTKWVLHSNLLGTRRPIGAFGECASVVARKKSPAFYTAVCEKVRSESYSIDIVLIIVDRRLPAFARSRIDVCREGV